MNKMLMTYGEWTREAQTCCKLVFDLSENYLDFGCDIIVDYWKHGFTPYEAIQEELTYDRIDEQRA